MIRLKTVIKSGNDHLKKFIKYIFSYGVNNNENRIFKRPRING